jgi:hypothetical protein
MTGAAPVPAPATGAVPGVQDPGPAPVAPPEPAEEQFEAVRAAGAQPRILGADLYDLELTDLVGVEDVLNPPRRPWAAMALTALATAAAIFLAISGVGEPDREGDLAPGQVELAGTDVAAGERVELDLSSDVPLRIVDPALAGRVDSADVEFSYAGVPAGTISAPVRGGEALLDPGITQRTVGGHATADVVLLAGENPVTEQETGVDATQSWYLTAPVVLGALLLLLAYGNLESSLKPLRSGHGRTLSYVGAAVSGVLAGTGLVAIAGALGYSEPTVPGVVATAAAAALACVAGARARVGLARRRRLRRAVRQAEKRLGVKHSSLSKS